MKRSLLLIFILASALHADSLMYKENPGRSGSLAESYGDPASLAWKFEGGSAFYSSAAVSQGRVYVGNQDHFVYCLELASGKLLWKTELPDCIYGSSPQIQGQNLYIACVDGSVDALDLETGKVLQRYWSEKAGFGSSHSPVLGSPLIQGPLLYFGSDNHEIYCLSLASGQSLWTYSCDSQVHDSAAAVMDGTLFMASGESLYALDPRHGSLKWQSANLIKVNSSPLAYGGRLYLGAGDNAMHCFDAASGKELWKFATPKGIMSSPSLDAKATSLVFGCADNNVYALNLDGKLLWSQKTSGPVLASPLITGSSVWIGSFDGHFYGLNLGDGKPFFDYTTDKGIFATAAEAQGKIVVGSRDHELYCFTATAP